MSLEEQTSQISDTINLSREIFSRENEFDGTTEYSPLPLSGSDDLKNSVSFKDRKNKVESPAPEELFLDESKMQSLGDRMKSYESTINVPPYQAFIIRADGSCFSKLTSCFEKPFDLRFQKAIIKTSNSVMNYFNARTVFCCSDEITLIFPPICTKEKYDKSIKSGEKNIPSHINSGRHEKLATQVAAKCSVLFNKFMLKEMNPEEKNNPKYKKIYEAEACFDARMIVIPLDNEIEIVNNIIWRSSYDCYRNCISAYGHHYFSHKQCHNKNCGEILDMLKEKGINSDDIPLSQKFGVICKKVQIKLEVDKEKFSKFKQKSKSKKKTEKEDCIRSIPYNFSTDLIKQDRQKTLELFFDKYFSEKILSEPYILVKDSGE